MRAFANRTNVSAHIIGFSSDLWQHWGVQALTRHVDSLGGPLNYEAGVHYGRHIQGMSLG
jgi:hypothetical protein